MVCKVGFIISSDVPCTKNIQKIVSVFANRTGRICGLAHKKHHKGWNLEKDDECGFLPGMGQRVSNSTEVTATFCLYSGLLCCHHSAFAQF